MADDLKRDLAAAVEDQPFHGRMINDGKNGGPVMGIVMLSQIVKSNNWTPEYHFPSAQAEAVAKKLENCRTMKAIFEAVREMIEKKCVKNVGGNQKVFLNEETLLILRESEIGRHAMNDGIIDDA